MKKLIKYIGVLTILIAGIFITTQNNQNQTAEAFRGDELCDTFYVGWDDCLGYPVNCYCPIVVEGELEEEEEGGN